MNLSDQSLEKIENLIPRFPLKQSAVLPLLHIFQEEKGFISKNDIEWIANKLDMQPINVYGLVTFYPMLRESPSGKRQIKVCRTLSCALKGSYKLCQKLQEELNCPLDGTSHDGNYSIEFVECLASCGTAPIVQVDQKLYENVSLEKATDFANAIRKETETGKEGNFNWNL